MQEQNCGCIGTSLGGSLQVSKRAKFLVKRLVSKTVHQNIVRERDQYRVAPLNCILTKENPDLIDIIGQLWLCIVTSKLWQQVKMILDILITLISVATIGSYLWSVKYHFESGALEAGAKLISAMVVIGAITFTGLTWVQEQPAVFQLLGAALQCLSLLLFWVTIGETRNAKLLAAFTDKNPGSLVTNGPYRFVRHPFYSSYLLFWFGWTIATANIWSMALFAIMFLIYWRAAAQEEEKFSNTPMADEYASFKAGRTRFIPFIL